MTAFANATFAVVTIVEAGRGRELTVCNVQESKSEYNELHDASELSGEIIEPAQLFGGRRHKLLESGRPSLFVHLPLKVIAMESTICVRLQRWYASLARY